MSLASVTSLGYRTEPTELGSTQTLLGREKELAAVEERLMALSARGGALVIRGDAGVGKSALLNAARQIATERSVVTLTAAGSQSEAHVAFAGLHQLLRPCLGVVERLPGPQQSVIRTMFGQLDGESLDFFLIALASLELLSEMAEGSQLLLAIDDVQWLDGPSYDVLAFVARRLEVEPIVMLLAVRNGTAMRVAQADLPELLLEPLGQCAAETLLDTQSPNLPIAIRQRVLAEALGNPLALIELPLTTASIRNSTLVHPLPLTERLERAFASAILGLSPATRALLLVAALDNGGNLSQIIAAASILAGQTVGSVEISAAVAARVVTIGDSGLCFRHPLVLSAVYHGAEVLDRRTAHEALACVYRNDPERGIWHRAASLTESDDTVAAGLEDLAGRAERNGAASVAASALEEAARLSTDDGRRGQLLLRAAWLAFELGHTDVSTRLVIDAQRLELDNVEQTTVLYMLELFAQGSTWPGGARISSLIEIAETLQAEGRTDRALDALSIVSSRCWWGNPGQEARDLVVASVESLNLHDDDPRLLAILAQADPVQRGTVVIDRIKRMTPDVTDPVGMYLVGTAANAVWAFDLALGFLGPAVAGLRSQHRMGLLAQALVTQAWAAVHLAREPLAVSAAQEATVLARETGQAQWALSAQLAMATIAAERGDFRTSDEMVREAEAELQQIGAVPMLSLVEFVRGRGQVAHQRYEEGFDHLRRALDPADPLYHPFIGPWGLSDLVESSVHTGRRDQASAYFEQLDSLATKTSGSLLRATVGYARAILSADDTAESFYRQALDSDLANWPCYRGRMLLWYGRWLRRQRRVADSRTPLRAAAEGFDALGFPTLSETARQELRSTGETSRQRSPEAWAQLTPQELQIARMAAAGHTNREIGEKLYLSHRTVEYHLHRLFPKIGVTRRSHLREAFPEEIFS